mmetsp:Transcript_8140/g.26844  ORF Transcript_8140/g.26844 Transcript_8140/m.26844 type:complete len:287 (+) Transcript_8140:2001-2861(+)
MRVAQLCAAVALRQTQQAVDDLHGLGGGGRLCLVVLEEGRVALTLEPVLAHPLRLRLQRLVAQGEQQQQLLASLRVLLGRADEGELLRVHLHDGGVEAGLVQLPEDAAEVVRVSQRHHLEQLRRRVGREDLEAVVWRGRLVQPRAQPHPDALSPPDGRREPRGAVQRGEPLVGADGNDAQPQLRRRRERRARNTARQLQRQRRQRLLDRRRLLGAEPQHRHRLRPLAQLGEPAAHAWREHASHAWLEPGEGPLERFQRRLAVGAVGAEEVGAGRGLRSRTAACPRK